MRTYFAPAALASLLCSLSASAASLGARATTCNGFSELCSKSYGNVSFVGAHDSYAVAVNNLAANQDYDVTQQLNDGIRMLQVQAHNQNGTIRLCHTSCSLYDGGTLQDYLTKVKTWMVANTNDIVSLLIVNINNLPPTQYDTVFKAAALDTLSFAPNSASLAVSNWPSLGSMIDSGKRLVTFMDNQADFTSVPYIIDEFSNVWETAFDVTDPTFNCNVNRTTGTASNQMYLINHFHDILILGNPAPDIDHANVTNSASGPGSLGAQVDTCVAANGRAPNFMLVDFYEYGGGSVFQVAATINGVTYNPPTPIVTPHSTATSSSASTTRNAGSSMKELLPCRQQFASYLLVIASIIYGASTVL